MLRGTLRAIVYAKGREDYLGNSQVLWKDFAGQGHDVSTRLKKASWAAAGKLGRTVKYLASSQINQEEVARSLAAEQKISEGRIGVRTAVEVCPRFDLYRNRETKKLDWVSRLRQGLFWSHYWMHPVFGFRHARMQTGLPFPIPICRNGREWLAHPRDAAGLDSVRQDNGFPWGENFDRAQQLRNAPWKTNGPQRWDAIAPQRNPIQEEIFRHLGVGSYGTAPQSEGASDIAFREPAGLRRLFPLLLRHAMTTCGSPEILRFLGPSTRLGGRVPQYFHGELTSEVRQREEGVRIQHRLNQNSLKLYDKAYPPMGSVLRPERTLHQEEDFRVYRPKEGDPQGPQAWRQWRRGIADLHRRAQVSQQANDRDREALASADDSATLDELARPLGRPKLGKGKRVRALHPFPGTDATWWEAVARGEFLRNGFRNRDLQQIFFGPATRLAQEKRRRSAWVSRPIRIRRAHGLIRKVPRENRYHVTRSGRQVIPAILAARKATVAQLSKAA